MTTAADLVARMEALLPLVEANAAKGEADRRVPEEVIDALEEAGLFRMTVPKRHGGLGVDTRTLLDVLVKSGEGDGSTAWVLTLVNVFNWLASLFPEQAQQEVFGSGAARVVGVLAPTSTAERVEGGWRLTGRWAFSSASWHATWAVLEAPIADDGGEVVDHVAMLVPAADFEIEDTWFVAGMRGTGSNTLVVDGAFVPDHRVMSLVKAVDGEYGTRNSEEILSRAAFVPLATIVLAAPQIGLGRAALRHVLERAGRKPVSYTVYERQADSTGFQLQVAEAANRIDTAYLHAVRAAGDIDDHADRGQYPSTLIRARVRADTGVAVQSVLAAFQILMDAHGAAGFAEASPLQRMWRDANTAGRHAIAVPQVNYEVYGKALLGAAQITPLV